MSASIATSNVATSEKAHCSAANLRLAASSEQLADATPAMRQFLEIKLAHPDCILFYRMGDFYELFFQDAEVASEILDIALTKRGKHAGEDIPMCGVPAHSHEIYLQRLIASGHKVAICEQLETPDEAKKRAGYKAVVHREVVRIVTPGTITEDALLPPDGAAYLTAIAQAEGRYAIAWLDLSIGDFHVMQTELPRLASDMARIAPKEILVADSLWDGELKSRCGDYQQRLTLQPASQFDSGKAERRIKDYYGIASLEMLGDLSRAELAACGALLEYIALTQIASLPRLDLPAREQAHAAMVIDNATRRNLELVITLSGQRKGSLLSVIDRCVTASGSRLLSLWLTSPLTDIAAITARQEAVEWALAEDGRRSYLRAILKTAPDMQRSLSRLCLKRGGPRDLLAIRRGLEAALQLQTDLERHRDVLKNPLPNYMQKLLQRLGEHSTLLAELNRALIDEPPMLARDGGFIANEYRADLDEFRRLRDESKQVIAAMQQRYASESGIHTLKIKFNNVLGYFIEVTAAHEAKIPTHFIHRQSLANNLRYTTTELAETARAITESAGKALQCELQCFDNLCNKAHNAADAIVECARALAEWDAVLALGELAEEQHYTRPQMDNSRAFAIIEGRHPVVESALRRDGRDFIANHCDLSEAQRLWLLTGPNMAGKSTFLRQNALIAILAQMGSFVPASHAHIGIIDRLFSRVGAADDLARGQSTFMVEMVETATILNQSTERSLVILDEIGRGTSTFDGLSIAWAVVEHLHQQIRCRALFATHYHELTELAQSLSALSCHYAAVKEWQGDVIFLHQIAAGQADRSYGIHVAKLAGLPQPVIKRAQHVLAQLESGKGEGLLHKPIEELPLFQAALSPKPSLLEEKLAGILPDELSPKQALELIYELKKLAS